ncbi:NAD(P)/FAD-dependent oxidoreductase [Hoeflea sp. WL0058]|uniref:NAD(P)/FAD-dependent oxidoreductase n=1 Tax=Flavimaribacter sediminis TaxID=2865987 RepID=A0AAE2ZQQ7_9HYPH|nr:NAD(P)/FAD-dependent oxidoreductase [Flavimaribacter sediminis]MBW8640274.1 NAD(P)/FAD-dependent oxidoreductase [Flavimaribacter sediminis]
MKDVDVDIVVVGAGVVGLAVARSLALSGLDVIVLEAAGAIGTETSSRNSEVIHAGLYYRQHSMKAALCVRGRNQLYRYCEQRGVEHKRIGKLVVATRESERAALEEIAGNAARNGVDDLEILDAAAVRRIEPELNACAALFSPSTGIIDTHGYMLSLQGEAEDHHAVISFHSPVLSGRTDGNAVELDVGGAEPSTIVCRVLVNAAGLGAARVAGSIEGANCAIPEMRYAKGNYFGLTGKAPFSHLIYPVPEPGGLGVHLTLDLGQRVRFGPDVEWLDGPDIDYSVDEKRREPFYDAIRKYWPGLPDGALYADYCGIRPKAMTDGVADFVIDDRAGAVINLFGVESPGLTASLALADEVLVRVQKAI